ncbi:MAG: hypothetical protein AB7U83_06160 [Vicinamibacterales bacterium]
MKPFPEYRGCEWRVALTKAERWGDGGQYFLVAIESVHDGPGSELSVLAFSCRDGRGEPAFAENYGPRGAGVQLVDANSFAVTVGEWSPGDPGCCPSHERRTTYSWNEGRRQFTESGSTRTARPQ